MELPVIIFYANHFDYSNVALLEKLALNPEQRIIILDDSLIGSSREALESIDKRFSNIKIIQNAISLGKSKSFNNGLNFFLLNYSRDCPGIVTLDSDTSIDTNDILDFSKRFSKETGKIIVGTESVNENDPIKFRAIHKFTRLIIKILTHYSINNYLIGILGIPSSLIYELIHVNPNNDDFEINVLMLASQRKYSIFEFPIQTKIKKLKYLSYFQLIFKYTKIIFVFIRFSIISITTSGIDFLVFSTFFFFFHKIFLAIVIARLIAGFYQFIMSRKFVFRSSKNSLAELIKYIILVVALMMLSYGAITPMVVFLKINTYLAKAIAEGTIFLLSFAAQRLFVFPQEDTEPGTNWDSYYNAPIKTSTISRKITQRKLIKLIKRFQSTPIKSICELGGGNSCFYDGIRDAFPNVIYTIVDNNERGLELFHENHDTRSCNLINNDVIKPTAFIEPVDLVFSVGLIEHFSKEDTEKAIKYHFKIAKPGSLVIITYPTPTWLYVLVRSSIEAFGKWMFPDERPLKKVEVFQVIQQLGNIEYYTINWPIIFTQGIIVARTSVSENPLETK